MKYSFFCVSQFPTLCTWLIFFTLQLQHKKPKDALEKGAEEIAAGITELVAIRKNATSTPQLEYMSMYVNFDRMLKKLDPNVVEDLNMEITALIYKKLKEQENIVIVNIPN